MPFRIASAATEADPDLITGRRIAVDRPPALPAPEAAKASGNARENENVVDVAFEPVTVIAPAPASPAPPAAEAAEQVITTLLSERRAAQGGDYDHPHTAGDCPFCRRAVAAYR